MTHPETVKSAPAGIPDTPKAYNTKNNPEGYLKEDDSMPDTGSDGGSASLRNTAGQTLQPFFDFTGGFTGTTSAAEEGKSEE